MAHYAIALDIGGTFTDVTLLDTTDGRRWTAKVPSTPRDPSRGFTSALDRAVALAGISAAALDRVFHGTTVATNAILERRDAIIGLMTTRGFKYVLEIGRHGIPRNGDVFGWIKPARPVPPERIEEITERVDRDGSIATPLDEESVRMAARRLKQQGVNSIAVCFLYSYLNESHERRAGELIAEVHPECFVSLSSEVLPQFREYERSIATVLNAYVAPHVRSYLNGLSGALESRECYAPLLIMGSNAGVLGADSAARRAIQTVLSGPAAGVLGAVECAKASGFGDIISIDVGGTSADVCLVVGGNPKITNKGQIGEWPLQVPMVDINTIGAGGGSIARVSGKRLTVGPQSAGATPGPVCYRQGGVEPTVTDAHLVLGRMPSCLLGGDIVLDEDAARRAIVDHVAKLLDMSLEEAADGILQIATSNMVGAIRAVSTARGHDPGRFALVPFGGAGPLHAVELAKLMNMPTIVVPRRPGVLSTWGMLSTDLKRDYVNSVSSMSPSSLEAVFAQQAAQAHAWLAAERVPAPSRMLRRYADLRYAHQGFELTVPVSEGEMSPVVVDGLVDAFHQEHRRLYTFEMRNHPVEIVGVRTVAIGHMPRRPPQAHAGGGSAAQAITGERHVYLGREHGWVRMPRYARDALAPGVEVSGPGIVEQSDSTIVLLPGNRARVDQWGSLIIQV